MTSTLADFKDWAMCYCNPSFDHVTDEPFFLSPSLSFSVYTFYILKLLLRQHNSTAFLRASFNKWRHYNVYGISYSKFPQLVTANFFSAN